MINGKTRTPKNILLKSYNNLGSETLRFEFNNF